MNTLIQDFFISLRSLIRRPAFSLTVVLLLGLGIGANVTIFALVHAAFIDNLPGIEKAEEVVVVFNTDSNHPGLLPVSYLNYEDLRDQSKSLSALAAYRWDRPNYLSGERPERLHAQYVSQEFFQVLGTKMLLGRGFDRTDFEQESPSVVLTHNFWLTRLGGDQTAIGRELNFNNRKLNVIGVAEPGFKGTSVFTGPDVWFPMHLFRQMSPLAPQFRAREWQMFDLVGRLSPGSQLEQATSELSGIWKRLQTEYPNANNDLGLDVAPVTYAAIPPDQHDLYLGAGVLLMVIVGLLLLIACSNVASLLFSRVLQRQQEIAIRLSLGAKRSQLIRQLLSESMVLTLAGCVVGVAIASWAPGFLWKSHPPTIFTGWAIDPGLNLPVLLFALGVSLASGLLVGLVPALNASRPDLTSSLKEQSLGAGTGRQRGRIRNSLVVVQLALSVTALIGAGLFLRSLNAAVKIDPGYDVENLAIINYDLGSLGYDLDQARLFHRRLEEVLPGIPGVDSFSVADNRPMLPGAIYQEVVVEGSNESSRRGVRVRSDAIDSNYFETLGIPLLSGSLFTAANRADSQRVAIINETMAKEFWHGAETVGRLFFVVNGEQRIPIEVLGVVADSNYTGLGEDPISLFYMPIEQTQAYRADVCLFIRTEGPASAVLPSVRNAVQALAPTLPLSLVKTMRDVIDSALWGHRTGANLLSVFAGLALLLSAIGLYANMTYTINERRREIAIRMALGAERSNVLSLVLKQVSLLLGLGLGLGFLLALAGGRLLTHLLYGIVATDQLTFAVVGLLLAFVGLTAGLLPALRALQVHPASILREP